MKNKINLEELAKKCHYELVGDSTIEISDFCYATEGTPYSLAVAYSKKEIKTTRAKAVLTAPVVIATDKTLLYTDDPIEVAIAKLARILVSEGYYPDYSKFEKESQTAVFLGEGSTIGQNVWIGEDVWIGAGCTIEANVLLKSGTRIGNQVHIGSGSVIGADSFFHYYEDGLQSFCGIGKVKIEDRVEIGCHTVIQRGTLSDTIIGQGSKLGNFIDIGHDVKIGRECKIVSQAGIAGQAEIGNYVQIFGQAGISNHVFVKDYATVMAKSGVTKDVEKGKTVSGMYARDHVEELKNQAKLWKNGRL